MRIPLNHRPVLSAALAAGLTAGCLAAPWLAASTALLVAWCAAAAVHLALTLRTMAETTPEAARQRAVLLHSDKWAMLGGSLAAAVASLGAIAFDLASAPGERVTADNAASATEYWPGVGRGLVFAGEDRPGAGDFLYLALTVGMTCQVSDVTTASAAMRRLVLLHGLVSFLFNAVIVGAAVNIAAGVVR